MAKILERRHQHCSCSHGCPTSAIITKWDCGCVQVHVLNDQTPGYDCTDFSGMRYHCGRSGNPREA